MSRSNQQTEPIRDKKYVMTFGRHKGKTLETIMGDDPNYLRWLSEEGALDIHSEILDQLDEDYRTAKGILYRYD